MGYDSSVSVSGRVVLGADDQTATLLGAAVDGLDDVDQLLFVLQHPIELIVVSGAEIAHHVFVPEEAVKNRNPPLAEKRRRKKERTGGGEKRGRKGYGWASTRTT